MGSPENPGRFNSIEFAVEVATAKYCDHLPLERQVKIMQREGLDIDSQTLWDQSEALARVRNRGPKVVRIDTIFHEAIHSCGPEDKTSAFDLIVRECTGGS